MTQTPFKAFNAEEKFDPIESSGEGLIKSAKENQDAFLASIVKRNADLFKYELEEATRKDQRFNKLAELSQTAAKIAKPILEAQTNEKYMEGAEAWYNASAKNQDILQAEFDAEEDIDIEEDTVHGKIVENSYKNNEIDIFLKEELSNLTRRQQTGFLRAMYQDRAQQYPMFLKQNSIIPVQIQLPDGTFTQKTLEQADNPNEYRQIEQRLYRAYIRPFATHEQAGVNKYLYEKMREHNKANYDEWYQKKTAAMKADAEEKAVNTVLDSVQNGTHGEEIVSFFNKYQATHGGAQPTRDFILGKLEDEMRNETFGQIQLDQLGDHPVEARDGSGTKPFREVFKRDFLKLERKYEEIKAENASNSLRETETIKQDEQVKWEQFVLEMAKKGETIHDAHEKIAQEAWTQKTGDNGEAPYLTKFKTVEERQVDDDVDFLKRLRKVKGHIELSDLEGMSYKVHDKVSNMLKEDKDITTASKTYSKRAEKEIASFAWEAATTSEGDPDKTKEYWKAYHAALDDYNLFLAEEIKGGEDPKTAHNKALDRVEAKFKLGPNNDPVADSPYFTDQLKQTKSNDKLVDAIANGLEAINEHTLEKDKLNYLMTTIIPGSEDYLEAGKKYGNGVDDIPYFYRSLARSYPKLTAWEILDAQLKASGIKEGLGEKNPVDSTLEIKGLEELRRKLLYKPNTVSTTQAKYDTEDAINQTDKEDEEDASSYVSVWNSNSELMFAGIKLQTA